jgi:dihydrofolate synthase/folylpolyglutamate synthase
VVRPAVTCVTQIELEHTDKLGSTLEQIAFEKAGILKRAVPCVVGDLPAEAREVVVARARELGAPLRLWGEDFVVREETGSPAADGLESRLHYAEPAGFEVSSRLPVAGAHQIHNAALAVAMVRSLGAYDDLALADATRRGLSRVALPGRLERVEERPCVIVDSAHTERSARALGRVLGGLPAERRHLVLSISRDKDVRAILSALDWRPDVAWLTCAEPTRSIEVDALARLLREWAPQAEIRTEPDADRAVRAARGALREADVLCCTGSVYLAGAARRALRERAGTG